jgi:putative hydrolase of HD superfamily
VLFPQSAKGATEVQTMQQVIDFILELDKLKGVTRKTRSPGLDRYENSAEHSWQIAMFAIALQPYADAPVDLNRVIRMLLVHDIGEIDTGDTIVFAEGGWEERKAAELLAVKRILGMLPAPLSAELVALWQEFELGETDDARFAGAIDRAMPALLNLNNQGQSWRENGISYERVVKRIGPQIAAGCPALWSYMESRLRAANESGWFAAAPQDSDGA